LIFNLGVDGDKRPVDQGGLQIWTVHSRLYDTNSGLFASGGQALLVDPGIFPVEIQGILAAAVQQHLFLQAVLLTHSHWDHILGPENLPGVPVIAQAAFNRAATGQKEIILREIAAWETDYHLTRPRSFDLPVTDLTFEEDMEFFLGEESLRFLAAPGHTPDQCMVYHPASGSLWAADMLSDLEIPLISYSLAAYQRTLAMISQLEIRSLIPGHGHPTDNRYEIQARLAGDVAYLEQLAEKVNQAVADQKSMEETVKACSGIRYRQGSENANSHRLNVESAYLAAGGDPTGKLEAGWTRVG
jgi:hydroxyacylglutathione hydrolase